MFQSHSDEECTKSPFDWSGGTHPEREIAFTSLRRLLQRDLPEAETLTDLDDPRRICYSPSICRDLPEPGDGRGGNGM